MRGDNNWHFGAGGNLSAGYRISENLLLEVYSGITWLSGNGMDGMPKHVRKENFIWESGLKLGWTFGKCGKKTTASTIHSVEPLAQQPHTPGLPAEPEEELVTVEPIVTVEPAQPQQPKETENVTEAEAVTIEFPAIYFVFNSISIAPGETAKMQEILTLLRENPDLGITLTGWCDNRGSVAVNKRISIQRAVAVKAWLVKNGISADRIRTLGEGIDYNEPDAGKARRVEAGKEDKR
ncbi:OmpA family protein [Bacteroides sp. 519]|uniref:OmpA family protein n=1 Tax=Bacteroides sp. 519 TaxID=2302937 RepID=UPI0013D75797|nr:OmpA family protein [Bacteroides sp. 519]